MTVIIKVGCVFPVVVVSILPYADLGPNYHREDAPHFTIFINVKSYYLNTTRKKKKTRTRRKKKMKRKISK